jgi:hypothetical protein
MGQAHLDHLEKVHLKPGQQPFHMASAGKEMMGFKKLTDTGRQQARSPARQRAYGSP